MIESIQSSGYKACIVMSGGGISAINEILSHAGASRFVLDAQIPYNQIAFNNYLKQTPDSYCSEDTTKLLSQQAYQNALTLSDDKVIGIACTAAIATNRVRRGADRAYVSITSSDKTEVIKVDLRTKGRDIQEIELCVSIIKFIVRFLEV